MLKDTVSARFQIFSYLPLCNKSASADAQRGLGLFGGVIFLDLHFKIAVIVIL